VARLLLLVLVMASVNVYNGVQQTLTCLTYHNNFSIIIIIIIMSITSVLMMTTTTTVV